MSIFYVRLLFHKRDYHATSKMSQIEGNLNRKNELEKKHISIKASQYKTFISLIFCLILVRHFVGMLA